MDKRKNSRRSYPVPIEISYVNESYINEVEKLRAKLVNHCEDGMCFGCRVAFLKGQTLYVRVKDFHPHGPSCVGLCEGMRSMTLAEVKWCHEVSDKATSHYQIGIKFYAPVF